MAEVTDSMEEKIINATIACIEQFGVEATTNRKIAEIAGINSAAVNYYFRSKEILLQRVMERTLDNAFDWKDFEHLAGDTPQERCEAIFLDILSGGVNFPGITRAHFHNLLSLGDYDSQVVARINKFVESLVQDLISHGYKGNRTDLEMSCMQLSYAIFMAVLTPRIFTQLNLEDAGNQKTFVHSLVHKIL
jgi:AcrR family transcriptional regulator